ncbi:MAG: hypothetical protein K2L53_03765, partial [Clostridia bacterium]|nr:hypothetical protein [Clostridia bacterium]
MPFSISVPDKLEEDAIGNTEMTINTNSSDGFGEFVNGYNYVFTDINLVDKYRADDLNTPYDFTLQKVTSASTRGTHGNPYVITTVDQWNTFASNATASSTVNTVYVLGQDIDFNGQTFNAVENFNGKFYGMGHTISNIVKDFGSAHECGVFRIIGADAIVADLNVDNVTITTTGGRAGTLIGSTNGGDILNCHVKGSVSGSANWSEPYSYVVGGLVGNAGGNNVKTYLYRCSLNVKMTITSLAGVGCGGIIGGFSCDSSSTLSTAIYDCLAIVDATCNANSKVDPWYGGITCYVSYLGEQTVENCVVYTNYTDNMNRRRICSSLFNAWPRKFSKLTIKNAFSDGLFHQGTSTYGMASGIWCNSSSTYVPNLNSM